MATQYVYLDEKLDSSRYLGSLTIVDHHKDLEISVHYWDNQQFQGILDEIRIHDKGLSPLEVSNLYLNANK
jgi:hypothetical protein